MQAQEQRIMRRTLLRKGERKMWADKEPDVGLDFYAFPGGYHLAYFETGTGYVCPPCAQERLEKDGRFPDGFQALTGAPEDYGGSVLCGACGRNILEM